MKHFLRLTAFSLPIALAVLPTWLSPVWAQSIPTKQQLPPATLADTYPYRPSCLQLIPQLSPTNPKFTAWGPVIGGEHQSWYGLPTGMAITKAITELDALGLCVKGGEVVPWQAIDSMANLAADSQRSPLERNVEQLKNAPNNTNDSDAGAAAVIFTALLAAGGMWLLERFEDRPWARRLMGEPTVSPSLAFAGTTPRDRPQLHRGARTSASLLPAADALPDRISQQELQASRLVIEQERSALEVLLASPFVSRAIYGFQRTGKTNLVASVMQQLAARGIRVFSLNLSSYGNEDAAYWKDIRSVRGDLLRIKDAEEAQRLINDAIALVDDFMAEPGPAILTVDEWAPMTASHSAFIALLEPLIRSLANKITGLSSSGMKRRKAIYTIASEMVAGTMDEFGKAVKKLSVCLVAIAPGHITQWDGQEFTFSWELYSQVSRNYPGVLSPPPEDITCARIAFINGEWRPLGTRALVEAQTGTSVVVAGTATDREPSTLPATLPLSTELQLFRDWLDKKVGETITLQMFKNARIFREKVARSEASYLSLCDKSIMKGWLSQTAPDTFFVLE
ncbi:MAG: hypothetical protein WA885_11395 [Phormidesmis sp.]